MKRKGEGKGRGGKEKGKRREGKREGVRVAFSSLFEIVKVKSS